MLWRIRVETIWVVVCLSLELVHDLHPQAEVQAYDSHPKKEFIKAGCHNKHGSMNAGGSLRETGAENFKADCRKLGLDCAALVYYQ